MFRSAGIAQALNVSPPAGPQHIIRYMVGQPLDFDPGSRYACSNFGDRLLGRVIERVAGVAYERYVQQAVLAPPGFCRMRLGKTLPVERVADEVMYYDDQDRTGSAVVGTIGERVPVPYGAWSLEALDAPAGWMASAVDLVRLASALDVPAACPSCGPRASRPCLPVPQARRAMKLTARRKRLLWLRLASTAPLAGRAKPIPGT